MAISAATSRWISGGSAEKTSGATPLGTGTLGLEKQLATENLLLGKFSVGNLLAACEGSREKLWICFWDSKHGPGVLSLNEGEVSPCTVFDSNEWDSILSALVMKRSSFRSRPGLSEIRASSSPECVTDVTSSWHISSAGFLPPWDLSGAVAEFLSLDFAGLKISFFWVAKKTLAAAPVCSLSCTLLFLSTCKESAEADDPLSGLLLSDLSCCACVWRISCWISAGRWANTVGSTCDGRETFFAPVSLRPSLVLLQLSAFGPVVATAPSPETFGFLAKKVVRLLGFLLGALDSLSLEGSAVELLTFCEGEGGAWDREGISLELWGRCCCDGGEKLPGELKKLVMFLSATSSILVTATLIRVRWNGCVVSTTLWNKDIAMVTRRSLAKSSWPGDTKTKYWQRKKELMWKLIFWYCKATELIDHFYTMLFSALKHSLHAFVLVHVGLFQCFHRTFLPKKCQLQVKHVIQPTHHFFSNTGGISTK